MPSKTFFDIAVIHILTTSTINRLCELYPEGRFEVRRFRPNIVIESASKEKKNDFIENSWVRKKMIIGKDIVLNITASSTKWVIILKRWKHRSLDLVHCIVRSESNPTRSCTPFTGL